MSFLSKFAKCSSLVEMVDSLSASCTHKTNNSLLFIFFEVCPLDMRFNPSNINQKTGASCTHLCVPPPLSCAHWNCPMKRMIMPTMLADFRVQINVFRTSPPPPLQRDIVGEAGGWWWGNNSQLSGGKLQPELSGCDNFFLCKFVPPWRDEQHPSQVIPKWRTPRIRQFSSSLLVPSRSIPSHPKMTNTACWSHLDPCGKGNGKEILCWIRASRPTDGSLFFVRPNYPPFSTWPPSIFPKQYHKHCLQHFPSPWIGPNISRNVILRFHRGFPIVLSKEDNQKTWNPN